MKKKKKNSLPQKISPYHFRRFWKISHFMKILSIFENGLKDVRIYEQQNSTITFFWGGREGGGGV